MMRMVLYLFHGQELQERKNQMPVQKMCYLGCQIVLRHLCWLQKTFIDKDVSWYRYVTFFFSLPLFLFAWEVSYKDINRFNCTGNKMK